MIKIEFESKALDRAISLLKDINSNLKWNPIPVLNGIRIHTDNKDTIRLYATNLEVSAEIEVVGKVIEGGEVVVDKRPFIDFLKMNSKISVHLLEGESDQVEIIGDGQRSIRLSNIQDDYPSVTPLISLDGSNAEAETLIKPADSSRCLYLLMPMRLQ